MKSSAIENLTLMKYSLRHKDSKDKKNKKIKEIKIKEK